MILKFLKGFFKKSSRYKKESLFLGFLLILSFCSNAFFILFPEKAGQLPLNFFKAPAIEKLSRVEFSPDAESPSFRVIKLKKKNKIYLEILLERPDGSFEQTQQVELKGNQEAFFDYWNESLSLFALDYDGDGRLDLGAPSFDSFFKAHFELLIYNKSAQKFELKKIRKGPQIKKRVSS